LASTRLDFQDLIKFLEDKSVKLDGIVDRTFEFNDARAAFEYAKAGKHVGKVVIAM
jgi:threonine dehydrogenase-like Zn-dependent dehydrogenase